MKIGIIGTGAYGIALATVLQRAHHEVTMWTKFEEEKELLMKKRRNEKLLPGIKLEEEIKITCDCKEVGKDKDLIIIAIPIAYLKETISSIKDYIDKETSFCIATKGIEQESGKLPHELLQEVIPTKKLAIISGPTFAIDLACNTACALTVAVTDAITKERVMDAFTGEKLVLEIHDDITGVELCGSLKNIIAVAVGIINGLGESDSTRAFLQKNALCEIASLIEQLGGNYETIWTYAGVGDLILTCNSLKSRNYTYGTKVGKKSSDLEEYIKETTVEGLYTLKSIYQLLKKKEIACPLIEVIYNICVKGGNPKELLTFLVDKKNYE